MESAICSSQVQTLEHKIGAHPTASRSLTATCAVISTVPTTLLKRDCLKLDVGGGIDISATEDSLACRNRKSRSLFLRTCHTRHRKAITPI